MTMIRIRQILLLLLLAVCAIHSAQGETVSQKQAKAIAQQFFNAAHSQVMGEPKLVYNGRKLTTNNLFPPFYVYNLGAGGFVVISAENKAYPILGYDLKENFNPDKINPSLKELLRLYALHIENIRYDSTSTPEADKAWHNIPTYIASILSSAYQATDPVTEHELAQTYLDQILDMEDPYAFASSSYTPDQWQYSIETELESQPDVVIGLIKGDSLLPVIVHGHKGDYYRMDLDGRNSSLWRLLPTEVISKGQVAVLGNPSAQPASIPEEEPHKFYDDFINEITQAQEQMNAKMMLREPHIQWLGGGHFTVTLPEPVQEMRLYSLDGVLKQREKFRNTSVASVNLTGQPTGFYFAVFFTDDGLPYSFKIFR